MLFDNNIINYIGIHYIIYLPYFTNYLCFLQSYAVHPELQLQVPGKIQVPPLRHPCEQFAIKT